MTQTNTDYLLQMTSAVTDRAYSAPAATDSAGKFDIHLSQAATSSGEGLFVRGDSQRTDTARYNRDERSWSASSSTPTTQNNPVSTSSGSSAADQAPTVGEVDESKPPATDADDDDQREADEADDTSAAEAAAGQAASSNTTKTDSKPKPTKNADGVAAAKAAAAANRTKTANVESDATAKAGQQATSSKPSTDAEPQQAEATAQLAVDATSDPTASNEEEVEPQETSTGGKRSKAAKGEVAGVKSKQAAGVSDNGEECGDSPVVAATKETSANVAQKAITPDEVSAASTDTSTTKGKSKAIESSDDDTSSASSAETRPGARNEAVVATSKVDAAQLVGGIPTPSAAGANTPPKGKDNELATKPIDAKGEPVAAALARMARNNITGTSDSTAGANDLPQVDPSRFIGRVTKAFQTAQDRGGTLQLRLSPPELGALRIELNVKDGVMSASLQTENSNARRLLLDHLPALRDRLAEQNIRVDRFDVDVRDDTGRQRNANGSQQQQFQHQPDQPAPRRTAPPQPRTRDVAATERIASSPIVGDAGLNLIV